MKITITRLELTNFKCFRSKEITFYQDITTIRGRNGVGKTTIADAILFCLFGKNVAGQSDLELFKTRENGTVIPNLDHSVEMELRIENETYRVVTLRRAIKEVWIKKRGSDESVFKNNTCEYFVNGESYTQSDYKKYIDSLISEEVFRIITNPTYFLSKKWQDQRDFLAKMVGSIEPEIIANTDDLVEFVNLLDDSNEDIISYRKHLSYQIKQAKEKIEKIPVRLEEQNKALPERLDWDSIKAENDKAKQELQEIEATILRIKSGNGEDIQKEEIRKEIKAITDKAYSIESYCRKEAQRISIEHDQEIANAFRKFNSLLNNQRDIEVQIKSIETLTERCNSTLEQCEKDAQAIRDEWAHNLSRTLKFGENESICPTCGQYLPQDVIAEKRQKAEENLNADKARIKAELTERAGKVKTLRADTEKQIADYKDQLQEARMNLEGTKKSINDAFAEKAKLEKDKIPTYEEILADNNEYKEILQTRDELQKKYESVGIGEEDTEQLSQLRIKRDGLEGIMEETNAKLATKTQYERGMSLINEIEVEHKSLIAQLSELEKKEDIAAAYQSRQNAILEERINDKFSLVKWKMFKTVNNGGDSFEEPYCECLVNGIPYGGGLNQAARLNAGLDIINALCSHYRVSAPIVLDNSESTINILQTIGQQIRLQVADTDLQLI